MTILAILNRGKSTEKLDSVLDTMSPPLFSPSPSALHSVLCGTPVGLTSSVLTKGTSSSLKLSIPGVPSRQTSHHGTGSEISIRNTVSLYSIICKRFQRHLHCNKIAS